VLTLALSPWLYTDWGNVTSPAAIAQMKANPKSTLLSRHTFGAGPYVYDPSESVTGDHCTYIASKYYYDKSAIRWSKIVVKAIVDSNTNLAALRSGQVDVAFAMPYSTVPEARSLGYTVVKGAGAQSFINFSDLTGKLVPALADVRVRQALNYAVDRKTIARALLGPDARPSSLLMPTFENGFKNTDYYTYDPAKAKALLAAAGYGSGFTFSVLCLGLWAGAVATTSTCDAVARNLAQVGVTLKVIDTQTGTEFGNDFASNTIPAYAVPFAVYPTWTFYQQFFAPGTHFYHWHDPVLDKLWLIGQREGPDRARATWQKLVARTVTQAYSLPISTLPFYALVSKKVGGVVGRDWAFGTNSVTEWFPTGK
jgi:peptide/nickel transport system substrate-binding protein